MISAGQPISAGDFIESSAGAGDEGKVPKLNPNGVLEETMFSPFSKEKLSTEYTRFFQVSNTVQWEVLGDENSIDNTSWTKIREIQINEDMPLGRVTVQAKTEYTSGGESYFMEGQWYINGSSVGTAFEITRSHGYSTYSRDFASLSDGDLIQLYVRVSGSSVDAIWVKDISINFDSQLTRINGLNLNSAILVTDDIGFDATLNL